MNVSERVELIPGNTAAPLMAWRDRLGAPGRTRLFTIGAWLVPLAFAVLVIWTGPARQAQFPNDLTTYLDACQRIYAGQRIHEDFHSPLGPAAFLPYAIAMKFTGPTVVALPWGAALSLIVFSRWTWSLATRRTSPATAWLLALFIGLLAGAAYTLDLGSWTQPSYAMVYNRLGWALFCLAALEAAVSPRGATSGRFDWGAFSTGIALTLLWLLKVNFGAVTTILVGALALLDRRPLRARVAGMVAGVLVALGALYVAVPYNLAGYASEIMGMAALQEAATWKPVATRLLIDNSGWLGGIAILLGVVGLAARWSAAYWRLAAVVVLVVGAGLTISLANCQFAELPSFALALVLGAEHAAGVTLAHRPSRWLGWAVLPLTLMMLPHAGTILHEAAWHQRAAPQGESISGIDSPAYANLHMLPWPDDDLDPVRAAASWNGGLTSPHAFASWVNDGLVLLRGQIRPGARVLSMDWSNPFPFALGLPPPRHDHIAWHWGRVVGDRHHVPPAILLSDVDFVMVPRVGAQPDSIAAKLRVYGPALRERFVRVEESHLWTLWARNVVP